jgi:hypothetical protein
MPAERDPQKARNDAKSVARSSGKPGPKLSAAAKAERDAQIIVDRTSRMRWREIAKKHNISERHARSIWVEGLHDQALDLYPIPPVVVIIDAIRRFEESEEMMAELFSEATTTREKLQVRKAELDALVTRLVLLQKVGYLPAALDTLVPYERDIHTVIGKVVEVFKLNKVPAEIQRQIAELLGPEPSEGGAL